MNASNEKFKAVIISHGKCAVCGKVLSEGLFLCKECQEKEAKEGNSERK